MQSPMVQPPPKRDYVTIAQLLVSGFGAVFSFLAAVGLALVAVIGLTSSAANQINLTSLFAIAWISLLTAGLAIPSLVYSIQRLGGRAPALPQVNGFRLASLLILLWPLVLLLGNFISTQGRLTWLLLPPLQLLAVGLPVWWLIEIARRKLPLASRQRGWGLVNFSIFITTQALMVAEILVLVVLVGLFAVWASTQPELVRLMQRLVEQMPNTRPNPDAILQMISPYLQNPLVIFAALGIIAWLIPMIEELFKPLAVWALAGRRLTPAEGFVAGALCGASFALLESLFYLSNPLGSGWAALAFGRAGTELLHTTTTALVGWALASAWQDGSYLRLGLTYLLAVILHGLWNGLNILIGLGGILTSPTPAQNLLIALSRFAPAGMVILVLLLFGLLWGMNRKLQNQLADQSPPGPILPNEITPGYSGEETGSTKSF